MITVGLGMSQRTGIPLLRSCVSKIKKTGQLKDIFGKSERAEALDGAFAVSKRQSCGKRLLVFDDLYRSGATASAVCNLLTREGGAAEIFLLTLTRTRKNL